MNGPVPPADDAGRPAGPGGLPGNTGATAPPAGPGDEEGPGGPFPGWGALYATVILWDLGLILLLYLFTVFLDVAP